MMKESWQAGLMGLVLLAALGIICPLLVASSVPLVDPDEGLHASIAQEMVERGDWIVPHQVQEPFLDKPILYFWAIAASLKVFGNSEAAVRLPGLLFGMLGTLSTAAVAWRMLGRRAGLLAGVFYASMILPLALAQVPAHDVALVPWVNLALLCFWESERVTTTQTRSASQSGRLLYRSCFKSVWAWTAAAGVLLGLAILTKGLAGVALVGVAYGGYLLVSRRLRLVHCFRGALALLIAASVASAWYFAVERAIPGFLRYYFFERHVLGFFTKSQPHGSAPWWYYFPILLVGGLPWVGYLPVLLRDALERRRRRESPITDACGRRPLLFLGCWFIGCTLFLTASHSKLITYIWPVFPAVAILAAVAWMRKIDGLMGKAAGRWMAAVVWSTCLIGPIALPATIAITQIALPMRFSLSAWVVAVAAGLTSLTPLWAWLQERMRLTVGLAAATVCGQLAILLWFALPQAAEALSARDLALHFNRTRELPSRVLIAQERVGSIVYYLDRELRDQLHPGQVANQDIDDPLPASRMGANEWIAIPDRHLHTALGDYDLSAVPFEQVGRFRLYRRSDIEPRALMGRKDGPTLR
jgi:4-amino-4-deoxy-L-arabinose transferase-like glycosyltransferase